MELEVVSCVRKALNECTRLHDARMDGGSTWGWEVSPSDLARDLRREAARTDIVVVGVGVRVGVVGVFIVFFIISPGRSLANSFGIAD